MGAGDRLSPGSGLQWLVSARHRFGVRNALKNRREGRGRLEVGKGWVWPPPFTCFVISLLEPLFTY